MQRQCHTKKGQSTVEYLLLFAAAIAVLIVFLNPQSGPMRSSVENAVNAGIGELESVSGNM